MRGARRTAGRRRGGAPPPTPVTITPHQEQAVHRLVTSGQKGLLLWHMMGTGKTLTALTFALNCPARRVVVFCPQELTYVWKAEIARVPALHNSFAFYAYERGAEFFAQESLAGDVLILDEAQHLVAQLREAAGARAKAAKLGGAADGAGVHAKMELMKTAHKVLALSGTPVYTDILDLSYLVNICAGKKVLAYNRSEFQQAYYRPNWKSRVFGYRSTYMWFVQNGGNALFALAMSGMSDLQCDRGYPAWLRSVETFFKKGGTDNRTSMTLVGMYSLAAFYGMLEFAIIMTQQLMDLTIADFKGLDAARFAAEIAPYVSYHKNRPGADPDFPRETMHYAAASYSFHQLGVWLKLTANCLGVETVADLGIASEADARYYTKRIDQSEYFSKGIVIGNLKNPATGEHSPKFRAALEKARGRRAVFYSSFAENGILALAEFLDAERVPYSYLDKGLSNAAKDAMLEAFHAAHAAGAQSFLLLHPCYSEGVSVRGAEQLHILEPIALLAKKAQVVARTSRYQSHAHLPAAQRHVHVFQWHADVKSTRLWLRRAALATEEWRELTPEVSMLYEGRQLSPEGLRREAGTPDNVLVRRERRGAALDAELTAAIAASPRAAVDCCIRYPSAAQEAACMRRTQRSCA